MANVLFFGSVAEITLCENQQINCNSLSQLQKILIQKWPEITKIHYVFAVNKEICNVDQAIEDSDEIALLPPFSGG